MATSAEIQELLTDTLNLFEWRLRRLEFAINGTADSSAASIDEQHQAPTGSSAVITRVRRLEHSLQQLSLKSNVVADLLKLRMTARCAVDASELTEDSESRQPELFSGKSPSDANSELDATQKVSMILSEAPAYSEVASQLRHLSDLAIPPTDAFTKLVALQPRMANAQRRQYQQAMEISDLRRRSSALILSWHQVFILGQGRCWADWDTRLRNAERTVRREEIRRAQDG